MTRTGSTLLTERTPHGCIWSETTDGQWSTDCGHLFELAADTPRENKMAYCCYCGGRLEQVSFADADMGDEP